ncbi:unnamed protein product [Leuciscus chuanchicus]
MNAMVCLLAPHPVWSPQQMDAMLIGVRLMGMQLLSSSELNPSSPLLFPSHVHPFWATCGSQPPSQPWSLTLPSKVQNLFFGLSCLPFFPPSTLFILSSTPPSVFLPLSYPSGRNEAIVVCIGSDVTPLYPVNRVRFGQQMRALCWPDGSHFQPSEH